MFMVEYFTEDGRNPDCHNSRRQTVRKEGCRVVASIPIAKVRANIAYVAQA